ncbi:ADL192Wp [Eremothecium gossypii ATCC 10895]|uniref:ADL192Wp n=1 Tax=Eremothecium gossypii (strain ATCC 10895 / CBS 109.51 / FGSC 9923 / NRRL Y-1056) TaxID=284811 RepID=Q75AW2_EREGS|nr:ADL192Wp [Eremothecium gossypii ATCC 10895]AAS51728.2 ADL192Wp [Eremothecium gossypii ATCC 10895]AEY96025.1 FADL192Wp [Eremothecium gossypii FDAG1]
MAGIKLSNVGLFRRRDKEAERKEEEEDLDASDFEDEPTQPRKQKSRRPKDTRFTQQRIASVNHVATPRTVVPVYLVLAVVFAAAGAVLLLQSRRVDELIMYYHDCERRAPRGRFAEMAAEDYTQAFHKMPEFARAPQWSYEPARDAAEDGVCRLRFQVPYLLEGPIYVSYLIENFYANHRRFVLSFSEEQINGKNATYKDVYDSVGINCRPLVANEEGKLYYPCGLIANSMFNDSFPFSLEGVGRTPNYVLSDRHINWSDDKNRFRNTKYSPKDVVPPPHWRKRFPDGYNEKNMPNIEEWEEFQNWMRTSTLPKFSKLIRRGDGALSAGQYEMSIGLHWPVDGWKGGKKAVYLSTTTSTGGHNDFLGIVYLAGSGICCLIAILILVARFFGGRKIGDPRFLSWNKIKY